MSDRSKIALLALFFLFHQVYTLAAANGTISKCNHRDDSVMTEPVTYKESFEEGNVEGWESYPPFQDTGFDPDFRCEATTGLANTKYSLMIEYRPSFVTNHKMGFVRKLSLIADAATMVSFYYRAHGYGDFRGLRIVLYGSDGKQYSCHTSINDDMSWHRVTVDINAFQALGRPLKPGVGISGVSVETDIPKTNPDVVYKLFLSEVSITAREPVQFQLQNPASCLLKNLAMIIPLRHYTAGESLDLSVRLPQGATLKSVGLTLANPQGVVILRDAPLAFNSSIGLWEGMHVYTFSKNDLPGQWTVTINGTNLAGQKVITKFNLWLTKKDLPHPRLFFVQRQIDDCKEKIKTDHWKAWWDSLVDEAAKSRKTSKVGSIKFGSESSSLREVPPRELGLESLAKIDFAVFDTVYLLPTLPHYFSIMEAAEKILLENTLIYAVTGDKAAGEYAKEALIRIAKWNTWNHPWFEVRHRETYYPVGELGVRAAFCYDIVYPLMSAKERDEISQGMLRNCIIPAYKEYVLHDRTPSATSNWIGNTVGGAICCALAIYRDNPRLGDLEPYLSGLIRKLEMYFDNTLDTAGAWGEGISYQAFALSNDLPTISAIKHVLGLDLANTGLLNSYKYFLYNFSNPEVLDNGDSHPDMNTLSSFAWLSSHSKDPLFQWLYMKSPHNNILDFMFGSDAGAETCPDILPMSNDFPELGAVVFRSGWSPDDIVMNFRCGPWYNHQHYDQGSFQLNAFGESLLPEGGYANYYNDPWYQRYYIQPVAHNTVLVDQNAGSQESGDYLHFIKAADRVAKITDFISTDFYSSVTGELADLYYDKLKRFNRTIIFMNRRYFVIYDQLKSSGVPHEYDLLFHFNNRKEVNLMPDNKIFMFKTNNASLFAEVVYPRNPELRICKAPTRFGPPVREPGYVQVSNARKSKVGNFVTILCPVKGTEDVAGLSKDFIKFEGRNFVGLKATHGEMCDLLFFRTSPGSISAYDISTDGVISEATPLDGRLSHFAAQKASHFSYAKRELIRSTLPVTFVASESKTSAEWQINSPAACRAIFYLISIPQSIELNGKKLEEDQLVRTKLVVSLSKGKNSLRIQY